MRKHRLTFWLVLIIAAVGIYTLFNFRLFSGEHQEERNVTVILKTLNVRLDFWQAVSQGAEAAAKEIGIRLSVDGPLSEDDAEGQLRLLEEAIERKPQAIVIAPIADKRMPEAFAKAREAGIQLVIINDSPDAAPAPAIVTTDHGKAGRLAGEAAIEATEGHPLIAVIGDEESSAVTEERLKGLRHALAGYPESVVGTYYADNAEDRAYAIVMELLRRGEPINAIIALNEPASQGAAAVLKELNKATEIKLIGFDSTSDEVQLLESGTMAASIVQKPFNMGYLGVKIAQKLMTSGKAEPVTYIDSNVITKENMYTTENQKLLFPFINSK